MLNCREVSYMLTLAPEEPISRYRKIGLGLHLMICKHCRRNQQQLQTIRQWLAQQSAAEAEHADHPLPADVRERIAQQLGTQDEH
ncbi:hypothetical protein [Chitinibacter sp. GC72]|uniref:anti-sigma factor family protein n=1 Tax=Chitinibacter sp. GC72 TaxID=1526917 RepID=UPI0012FA8C0A|nr:hypothetical protein [Chitinibacter sp. GC72]